MNNGVLVTSPQDVIKLWTTHLSRLATPATLPEFDQNHFDLVKYDFEIMESITQNRPNHHQEVSREETRKAVAALNPGRAADIVGLQSEHLKLATYQLVTHLQAIANTVLESGGTLDSIQRAYVLPIHKKGKDEFSLDSYRGITITPTLSKLLEHIVGTRIRELFIQNPLQYGFSKGLSPVLAILAVTEAISHAIDTKTPLYVITLDVKKAFDVVCQTSLLRKLFNITDVNSWRFIQNSLQTISCVRLMDKFGDQFQVKQGVGQGKILSTHNYKVYINNLLNLLQGSGCGANIGPVYLGCPTCADDIVLLANTPTDMQALLNIVYSYSTRERYEIHPDKSRCIAYASKFPPTFYLNGCAIQQSSSLTHLGVDRHHNDSMADTFIEERISLGRRTAYSLMGAGFHGTNGISPAITVRIYQTYVIPRYLYGLEALVLKKKQIKQLSDFHKQCIKDLQSLPLRTATSAIHLLGGILPLEAYLDSRIATLLCMVGKDRQSPLSQIAVLQYATKGIKTQSWFIYAGDRLARYSLDPLDLLQQRLNKNQVKNTISRHWHSLLVSEATERTTLAFMNCESIKPEVPHPIWTTVGTKPSDTRKAAVKARILTGTYILQSNKARFNQYMLSATCHLCQQADENLEHFLIDCAFMCALREEYFGLVGSIFQGFRELSNQDKIKLLVDYNCDVNGIWDREALEIVTRDYIYRLHCRRTWFLNKEAPI
jgi:hypothetical protein